MDSNFLGTLKTYLRRKYAGNLTGLRKLADETFLAATETVTLTSLAAEGGSQAGQITCPKGLLLQAIEETLAALDTSAESCAEPTAAVYRFR